MIKIAKYAYTPKQIIHKTHYRAILSGLRNQSMDINEIIDVLKKINYQKTKCNNVVNMTYILMDANLITKNEDRLYSITANGISLIEAYIFEQNADEIYTDLLNKELNNIIVG